MKVVNKHRGHMVFWGAAREKLEELRKPVSGAEDGGEPRKRATAPGVQPWQPSFV